MAPAGASGGIGITDDHAALQATAARWTAANLTPAVTRAALDGSESLPPFWDELAAVGWLGLHLPEAVGGEGFGLAELAVVLEELGRACAPGPFVPTVVASAAIERWAGDEVRAELLPRLATGRAVGAVGLGSPPIEERSGTVDGTVDGTWDVVLGGALADVAVLPVRPHDGGTAWLVLDTADLDVEPLPSVDRTRRVARLTARDLVVAPGRRLAAPGHAVEDLAATLLGAEAVGGAAWCVATAAEHAVLREQFGRPIGQFQAVKHRCADMLCALERARAAVWDAVRGLDDGDLGDGDGDGAALAPEAAYTCAKDCIQVLGGIGFTWDHDAHLFLKRAMATRALVGSPGGWRRRAAALAAAGARHHQHIELPSEAEGHRAEVRRFVEQLSTHDRSTWNRRLAEAGYLAPHWPRPWGLDASPLQQVVIDDELRRARVRRPHLAVGAWALPTIIVHGSPEQRERFIPPTLRGELTWCQLFSEPGAGSDLASLSTKAVRTDGGWLLTGQKVWTTLAHAADWGICLARTDPTAPRHDGIGCFLVDMASDGLDVRPLREITGAEMFNEVFLSDVFVPDDCVVGGPTDGWKAARTTLANERVSMGNGASMGPGVEALLDLARPQLGAPGVADAVGAIVAESLALAAMGTRLTLRALSGAAPGPEASIRKLLGVELDQRVQELGLELVGPTGAGGEGEAAGWVGGFLGNRSLSIAGGTSEIQRNVVAERLLGLPRDP